MGEIPLRFPPETEPWSPSLSTQAPAALTRSLSLPTQAPATLTWSPSLHTRPAAPHCYPLPLRDLSFVELDVS